MGFSFITSKEVWWMILIITSSDRVSPRAPTPCRSHLLDSTIEENGIGKEGDKELD
jgi:hypothetical protein